MARLRLSVPFIAALLGGCVSVSIVGAACDVAELSIGDEFPIYLSIDCDAPRAPDTPIE